MEHIKRYTTIGTANDQGKTSGVLASGHRRRLLGAVMASLGTTTHRPPYSPVSFAALAGRDRGALSTPARHGHPLLARRARRGVRGRRPVEAAVVLPARARTWTPRCCANAAPCAGCRHHGRLDARQDRRPGADAAEFLDRIYTNDFEKPEGRLDPLRRDVRRRRMVIDDGVTMRLADDRFLVTTTTGNAAGVLDWLEEWLQTEWPELRVALHVGHRAVGDGRGGRPALARRVARSRPTWTSPTRPSPS